MADSPTVDTLPEKVTLPEIFPGPQAVSLSISLGLPRLREVCKWLVCYGYATEGEISGPSSLVNAAVKAGRFLGLSVDWTAANETIGAMKILQSFIDLMAIPRCGHPDMYPGEPHLAVANGWRNMGVDTVLVRVVSPLPALGQAKQEELTAKAINAWQAVCGVRCGMTGSKDKTAHISISLCDRTSGSDGRGAMLAFTYLPTDWQKSNLPMPLLFDIAEAFGPTANGQTIGYSEVVTHELGHALIGLSHAPQSTPALMAPYYKPGLSLPQSNDIERALKVWPLPAVPTLPPVVPPVVTVPNNGEIASVVINYKNGTVVKL